uniref:Uncharacterized protein n=1 Tax=Brassica oleracea var. oleracea TaxID=109376 RepID=A0A0D2ZT22_BRAOL
MRRCKPLVDPITDAPSRSATVCIADLLWNPNHFPNPNPSSLSRLKLALSRRDQVNQTFSFFPVHDPTKQAARPRPDSKNDQLAASFSLWWSKSTLHKFLKDYAALNLSEDNYLKWVMNTSVALKSRGLGKCIILTDGNNAIESEKHKAIKIIISLRI